MSRLIRTSIVVCVALGCRGELEALDFSLGHEHRQHDPEDPPRALDPECSQVFESRAGVVREAFAGCETDADCTLVGGPGCLSEFLCSNAITHGNEEAYLSAAQTEVDDYIQQCGSFCSVADCVQPSLLRAACDTATSLCITTEVE